MVKSEFQGIAFVWWRRQQLQRKTLGLWFVVCALIWKSYFLKEEFCVQMDGAYGLWLKDLNKWNGNGLSSPSGLVECMIRGWNGQSVFVLQKTLNTDRITNYWNAMLYVGISSYIWCSKPFNWMSDISCNSGFVPAMFFSPCWDYLVMMHSPNVGPGISNSSSLTFRVNIFLNCFWCMMFDGSLRRCPQHLYHWKSIYVVCFIDLGKEMSTAVSVGKLSSKT